MFFGVLPVFGGVSCVIRFAAVSVEWVGFEKRGECWVFSGLLFADLLQGGADVVPLRLGAVEVCVDGFLVPEQVDEWGALLEGEEDRADVVFWDVDGVRDGAVAVEEVGDEAVALPVACDDAPGVDLFAVPCGVHAVAEFYLIVGY